MHEPLDLRRSLSALVERDARRRREREEARDRERLELDALRDAFERITTDWRARLVKPRLEMLVDLLPARGTVELAASVPRARATFPPSEEFPVAASLTVTMTPSDRYRYARVEVVPLLIPMLQGHPAPMGREFGLDADLELPEFLDRGILEFARSFLHVRDPDSPYQIRPRSPAGGRPANSVATASLAVPPPTELAGSAR